MKKILFILILLQNYAFAQWSEVPFYQDAKYIKSGKIKVIHHRSFKANGEGDITGNIFEAVYQYQKDGTIGRAYFAYPDKSIDSIIFNYNKGKLISEQHFSNRRDHPNYYEVTYSYDKKGLLEEKRDNFLKLTTNYYYEKNLLVQEVSSRSDSETVTRIHYGKDKDLNKKTTVIDNGNGKKSEEIELSSRDEKGNLIQEMLYSGTTLNNLFFYKNYYLGNRLEGFSQYNQDMQTINFTVAYRYNENNLITYESLKFHKSPPNNHEFGSIKASTYEYYFW